MPQQILVVDDEPQILQLVKMNLERAGYQVRSASNGREALEAVQAERPDLIVMDVTMPEMTGLEALRNLKTNEATSAIPVVMLTANVEDEDVMQGWQGGAHAYLSKPFNPRELLTFVRNILDSESAGDGKSYEVTITD